MHSWRVGVATSAHTTKKFRECGPGVGWGPEYRETTGREQARKRAPAARARIKSGESSLRGAAAAAVAPRPARPPHAVGRSLGGSNTDGRTTTRVEGTK